jgi:uncharacterized protein (TIGR03435 family)
MRRRPLQNSAYVRQSLIYITVLKFCLVSGLVAQALPGIAFDVASVKPSLPASPSTSDIEPRRFRCTNKSVAWLMGIAYKVQDNQLLNAPAWVRSVGFDIDAKIEVSGTGSDAEMDLGPLLRNLLEDRFRLKFHREDRPATVYSLVVAKNGPRLKPSQTLNPSMGNSLQDGKMVLKADGLSLAALAGFLSRQAGGPVTDKTGLTGIYDLKLEWSPDPTLDSPAGSIFSVLQEQLGLKIEATKGSLNVVVIDSVERPSEN